MSPFSVVVESAAEVTQVTLQFRMQGMEMAVQRYRLLKNKSGTWQAEVMLPVCSLGRSDWVALLDVQLKQEWWRVEMYFEF